jgi:hypothetical protein
MKENMPQRWEVIKDAHHLFHEPLWMRNARDGIRHKLHGCWDCDNLLDGGSKALPVVTPVQDAPANGPVSENTRAQTNKHKQTNTNTHANKPTHTHTLTEFVWMGKICAWDSGYPLFLWGV